MFSLISDNWAGEPLVSYETVLKYIRTTRSRRVSTAEPVWTGRSTEARHRVTPEEKARVRLKRRKVLPQWNYTIYPHTHPKRVKLSLSSA